MLLLLLLVPFVGALLPSAHYLKHGKTQLNAEFSPSAFWSRQVEYVDLNSAQSLVESPTAISLPLFILGGAFYPQGISYLNVFEMKYRTMMFDISQKDDTFGYIHSENGRIGSVGTLCKVTSRELLEDGRQFIAFEGVSRFRVRRILKTLPYVLAEVEPNLEDTIPEDESAAIKLEQDAYDALKYYMRLMKTHTSTKNLVITKAAKDCRPSRFGENAGDNTRRTSFSFSLANMIQMTSGRESQLLLQCTNIMERLNAEKTILSEASEMISEKLVSMGTITADKRDEIRMKSLTTSFDEDILPVDAEQDDEKNTKDEWDIANIE